jgi:TatD DNase family protein
MPLFDTHAHLYDDRFANDFRDVLDRAETAGVVGIIALGIDLASSRASVRQATDRPWLRAAVGIHPNGASEAGSEDWDAIAALAADPRVAAIGETGLDRHWDRAPFPLQQEYFDRHLDLARRLDKPIAIHCREAEADVERMLRTRFDRHGPIRGVMHSYCGDAAHAEKFLAMGLHVSFAGMLTYKTADAVRAVAAMVPWDRLLVETDAPYLAPVPVRGKRNEPAYAAHTAARLAEVRGVSCEEMGRITTANAGRLFGGPTG